MRLKTYIVNNISEAMPLIKRDLGVNALILNTKNVKTGGFLGLFKKEKLEVIAAVESNTKGKQQKTKDTLPVTVAVDEKVGMDEGESESPKVDVKMTNELVQELKAIKHFMLNVVEEDRLPASLKPLKKQFSKQEMTSEIQSEIYAKLILRLGENPKLSKEQVFELAREEIIALIKNHQKLPEAKNPAIICFIGPTGVGKTTTIAKVAAEYILREDKKVGLITSDTYRIAAVEQLRTYANILNIPIKAVESSADLMEAMRGLCDCDIILMDTAGRNYQQKQYIDDLEELLPEQDKVQVNLVLSLTSKYEDMKRIIENFKKIKMDQLILTKKDETRSSGAILNLIHDYAVPIRYITNGQNVPDDIFTITPEMIADFVLGEDDND